MAKAGLADGMAAWQRLDRTAQIYLGGLALTVFCCVIFDVISLDITLPKGVPDMFKGSSPSVSALEAGANGKLAVLSAIAGIGLWVWNRKAVRDAPWLPLALAVAAGFSAFMLLVLMLRTDGGSMGAAGFGAEIDVDMTLLGFWVPLLGAAAATAVAVQSLRRAR